MLKTFKILGIAGIMSLSLVSCFAEIPKESNPVDKKGCLKYCGQQQVDDYRKVYVYEDNEHKKIIYFANDLSGHSVSVAVTDMKE